MTRLISVWLVQWSRQKRPSTRQQWLPPPRQRRIFKIGDRRHTINTPAVTIVAAWISAETGVGPSIASGNHVCKPSWADFPIAPKKSRRQHSVIASTSKPRKAILLPCSDGICAKILSKFTVPVKVNSAKIPSAKPTSPTRLTTNALMAAAQALGRLNQNRSVNKRPT